MMKSKMWKRYRPKPKRWLKIKKTLCENEPAEGDITVLLVIPELCRRRTTRAPRLTILTLTRR